MRQSHGHEEHFLDTFAAVSGMRGWNAGCKTALSAAALVICIAADDMWVSAVILILSFLMELLPGRRKPLEIVKVMRIPALFILLGGVAAAIELSGSPVSPCRIAVGSIWIGISKEGFLRAVSIVLKAFAAVSAMYMLTLSTPMEEILGVLERLHCPALLLELMHMIYRNIFILTQMHSKMQTAASARMGHRDFRASVRSFGQIGANLFLLSFGRANAMYDAMAARGYNGRLCFLERKKPIQTQQIVWSCVYLGIAVLTWAAAYMK